MRPCWATEPTPFGNIPVCVRGVSDFDYPFNKLLGKRKRKISQILMRVPVCLCMHKRRVKSRKLHYCFTCERYSNTSISSTDLSNSILLRNILKFCWVFFYFFCSCQSQYFVCGGGGWLCVCWQIAYICSPRSFISGFIFLSDEIKFIRFVVEKSIFLCALEMWRIRLLLAYRIHNKEICKIHSKGEHGCDRLWVDIHVNFLHKQVDIVASFPYCVWLNALKHIFLSLVLYFCLLQIQELETCGPYVVCFGIRGREMNQVVPNK